MLELGVFLAAQLLINLFVWAIPSKKLSDVFRKLAVVVFPMLMIIYPLWSWQVYDFFYPPDPGFRCGNPLMAMAFFLWVIGTPIVIIFQLLLNWLLHRKRAKISA